MKDLTTKEIFAVLNSNYVGHLAFIANGRPYTIPITYYFDQKDSILAYAGEGHKVAAMRLNPNVSLQVETIHGVENWESALVHGVFEELHNAEAKFLLRTFAEGVKSVINLTEHKSPQFISEFTCDVYASGITVVYRIKISEMTGKKMGE